MSKKVIGIDLGGTTAKFAILSQEGDIQTKWSILTDISEEGSKIVPSLIKAIQHHMNLYNMTKDDFVGIGMGTPGAVDSKKGTVTGAYNLNWKTTQFLKEEIEGVIGIPFFLDNDANVAALGEVWSGAGNQEPNIVFMTLGTGIGGGIIIEGDLLHGAGGAAGEVGHMTVDPEGYVCTCGKRGCLETVASATGIVRLARDMSEQFAGDSLLKYRIDDGQVFHSEDVFNLAEQGDLFALIVVDRVTFYLGMACGNIANILNPSAIILGGGVSKAGAFLLEKVQKQYESFTYPSVRETTEIRLAELGNDAGVIGAASLALKKRNIH